MNVFVAGGTGLVGKKVVELLRKAGHNVVVYHRKQRTVPTRADVVVNCVGIIKEGRQTFEQAHLEMTEWLLKLAEKLEVKQFVHVSAIGARPDGVPYQRTKWQAEQLVQESGLQYAIIRPSMIFGSEDKSVNTFRKISRTGFCPLFSEARVQPVHVDVVAAVVAAACERKIRNRIVEVGGPEAFTYRELLDRIHRGVHPVKVPRWLMKIVTTFSFLSQSIPTDDMLQMMTEDNVTEDKTVEKLGIKNVKLR